MAKNGLYVMVLGVLVIFLCEGAATSNSLFLKATFLILSIVALGFAIKFIIPTLKNWFSRKK